MPRSIRNIPGIPLSETSLRSLVLSSYFSPSSLPEFYLRNLSFGAKKRKLRCRGTVYKLGYFASLGTRNALNHPKENLPRISITGADEARNGIGCEEKKAAVHEIISGFDKNPANSSTLNHHFRVLNKIVNLLSVQRTTSEDEEFGLLLAGLPF